MKRTANHSSSTCENSPRVTVKPQSVQYERRVELRTPPPLPLTPNNPRPRHGQTDRHHRAPEANTHIRRPRLPRAPLRQIDKTQGRENVGECTSGCRADELEDDAEVVGYEGDHHGADDEGGGEDEVAVGVVGFAVEVVFSLLGGFVS